MRVATRVTRYTLSLVCTLVAAVCVWRGMRHLFGFEAPRGVGPQVAGLSGVGPALGYFAAGVLCLFGAGELYPKADPPEPPDR